MWIPVRSSKVAASRSTAAARPKSSSADGSKLDCEAPHVLQCLDGQLSHVGLRAIRIRFALGCADRSQSEQDRRQSLARLVVKLPREPAALELLSLDNPADRLACDSFRQVDGDRGACGEDLGEAEVGVRETRIGGQLVVHHDDPDRAAARDERNVEPCSNTHLSRGILIRLGVVEYRVDAGTGQPSQDMSALRPFPVEGQTDQLRRAVAVGGGDP